MPKHRGSLGWMDFGSRLPTRRCTSKETLAKIYVLPWIGWCLDELRLPGAQFRVDAKFRTRLAETRILAKRVPSFARTTESNIGCLKA
mmetsp:Transcript_153753/g.492992  ORF Transcript_153753/g.492992 Transcript_153753/m.492992 type:complete len:88 (+) Transcript_153753:1839-2102(+)